MEWVSKTDTMGILYFLLPGFLAASIFYSLTAHPKKEAFERVVQALIFTIIVKVANIGLKKLWLVTWHRKHIAGMWTDEKELIGSVTAAVLVGFILSIVFNLDLAHRALRRCRVTKRTSYPSEWYSGFHRFRRELVLHLTGERRLKGWAEEWPDQCDKGHFLIECPEWLGDDGTTTPFSQVKRLLIRAEDVEMVEFLCTAEELPKKAEDIIAEQASLVQLHRTKESEDGKAESEARSGTERAGAFIEKSATAASNGDSAKGNGEC